MFNTKITEVYYPVDSCPFCYNYNLAVYKDGWEETCFNVSCLDCKIDGPKAKTTLSPYIPHKKQVSKAIEKCIQKWNDRKVNNNIKPLNLKIKRKRERTI